MPDTKKPKKESQKTKNQYLSSLKNMAIELVPKLSKHTEALLSDQNTNDAEFEKVKNAITNLKKEGAGLNKSLNQPEEAGKKLLSWKDAAAKALELCSNYLSAQEAKKEDDPAFDANKKRVYMVTEYRGFLQELYQNLIQLEEQYEKNIWMKKKKEERQKQLMRKNERLADHFQKMQEKIKHPENEETEKINDENLILNESAAPVDSNHEEKKKTLPQKPKERTFDNYIFLHTGDFLQNEKKKADLALQIAKCLAACELQNQNQQFHVSAIRANTSKAGKKYCLMYLSEQKLRSISESPDSLKTFQQQAMESLYGVPADRLEPYKLEMSQIYRSMLSGEGRTEKYKNLCRIIGSIANMNPNQPLQEKKQFIIQANCALMNAIEDYTKGRKKVRTEEYGRLAFHHAMDALATIKQYTGEELGNRIREQEARINHVRGLEHHPDHKDYINLEKYGADAAQKERAAYNLKQQTLVAEKAEKSRAEKNMVKL